VKKARTSRGGVDQNKPPAPAGRLAALFFLFFFCAGAFLRLLLCWFNPAQNAFDNHYEPIFLIMQTGAIPAKDACFQCYHPPVFYWISAIIGDMAVSGGMTPPHMLKLLQFVCCFYGIATLGVCYLILKKFPLSAFASAIAFGVICFLPRHIYMSAMNSNDTISYLCVAISIYLTIVALEGKLAPLSLVVLSIVLTVTVFTKYTAFAVLPAVPAGVLWAYRARIVVSRKQLWLSIVAVLALPLAVLGGYMATNVKHYHTPLPWNVSRYDPSVHRPRDPEPISFVSFKPWEDVVMPVLAPGKLHSFWTMLYSGMWFDTEPYFLSFLDAKGDWWQHYYSWYRGEEPFPAKNPSFSRITMFSAAGLILLGLVPLALVLVGAFLCVSGKWKTLFKASPVHRASLSLFPVLLGFNIAGIIALTVRLPVYNSIKPSYLLNAMPAFVIFTALGVMLLEESKILKRAMVVALGTLFTLVAVHMLHIVFAIRTLITQVN
jgi:hypothetical protein